MLRRLRAFALLALQLLTSMAVAAVFFGTIRLRSPYDPYAIILAIEGWTWAATKVWPRLQPVWARLRPGSKPSAR